MTDANGSTRPRRTLRSRQWIAVAVAPMAVAPGLLLGAWDGMELFDTFADAAWDYLRSGLLAAYSVGGIAGAMTWALFAWRKLPVTAWTVIPLFIAACSVVWTVSGSLFGGVVMGVLFGAPISIAFCVISGASWRRR